MDALIAEIERRASEAHKTPQGPDYRYIVGAVACENDVTYEVLRSAWLDSTIAEPN